LAEVRRSVWVNCQVVRGDWQGVRVDWQRPLSFCAVTGRYLLNY